MKKYKLILLFLLVFTFTPMVHAEELISQDETYQEYLDEGLMALMDEDYQTSAEAFKQAALIRPNDPTATVALKSVLLKVAEQEAAQKKLEDAIIDNAKLHYKQKHYLPAILEVQTLLKKKPNHSSATKLMKRISRTLEEISDKTAEHLYNGVLYQGVLAYTQGDYEQANFYWKNAQEIQPGNPITPMLLTQITEYLNGKQQSEAQVELKQISRVIPSSKDKKAKTKIHSKVKKAQSLLAQNQYIQAKKILTKYIDRKPNDSEAQDLLQTLLTKQNEAAALHYNEGLLAYANGDYQIAFLMWRKVLEINPDYSNIRAVFVKAFLKLH